MNPTIRLAESPEDIARCFDTMHELRPYLLHGEFVERVQRQQREGGYRLALLESDGAVRSVAGYRFAEYLAWGRILYVDDLVTRECDRGFGFGSVLFDWLVEQARAAGCVQFHLDSGVQRFGAHRFYLHKGMDITAHHFDFKLSGEK